MTHILIADPNPATRNALALLLSHKLGISSVEEAVDVEALIRALSVRTYDLLLLDWRLYGAPAPETCRLLRKAYPELKIILLSVDPADQQLALEAGAAFIHKGASPDEVIASLERSLAAPLE
jgi:DNA-binding NarL/FixJ family response regulator